MYPFQSTAEDIQLLNDWWHNPPAGPPRALIRITSVIIRRLILENEIRRAWNKLDFNKQPVILAPDLLGFVEYRPELDPQHVVKALAGGGNIEGVNYALCGIYKVDNKETGIPASASKGFAVQQGVIARRMTNNPPQSELDRFVNHPWTPEKFSNSVSLIVREKTYSRRDLIQYWAHYCGAAHHNQAFPPRKKSSDYSKYLRHREIEKLEGHFNFTVRHGDPSERNKITLSLSRDFEEDQHSKDTVIIEGLLFELLSMGQAIGRSPDMLELAERIEQKAMC
jgi:hypothetical protein